MDEKDKCAMVRCLFYGQGCEQNPDEECKYLREYPYGWVGGE